MADRKYYCICDAGCKFETLTKEQIYAAIMQAVNNGVIGDCDTGFVTTIKTVNGYGLKFFIGTQSEYEVLTNKENVFAIITNDNYKESLFECIQDLDTNFTDFVENIKNGNIVVGKATHATHAVNAVNATKAKVLEGEQISLNEIFGLNKIETDASYSKTFTDSEYYTYFKDGIYALKIFINGFNEAKNERVWEKFTNTVDLMVYGQKTTETINFGNRFRFVLELEPLTTNEIKMIKMTFKIMPYDSTTFVDWYADWLVDLFKITEN